MTEETITITKSEYKELTRARQKLSALMAGGVDNWEWYGEALEEFWAEEEDEE